MKKEYTKRQIVEAINHWNKVLESLDENESNSGVNELFKMAQQIIPNQASIAKKALKECELNESTASGLAMGIMGTLLALSMMGKISLNMKDALSSLGHDKADVKVIQQCDKSLDEISAELDEIADNISAIRSTHNLDDPSLDQLLDATKEQIDKANREELFKKIMAEP